MGPTSAENSVLLDYVSPILPVNLWNAGRLRHASVQLLIYGGLILKLVTVASTGLLAPIETVMPFENIALETLTAFSAVNFSFNYTGYFDTLAAAGIGYEAYALIANNLPFPDGTQPALAFQQFRIPQNSTAKATSSTIRATVEAFRPIIQCEQANLTLLNASTGVFANGAWLELFSTPSWASCSPSSVDATIRNEFQYSPLERPSRQLYGGIFSEESTYGGDSSCGGSFWGFVTMFDVRYNQTSIPGAILRSERQNDSDSWGVQILQTTAVACSISYSMVDARVTYDLSQDPLEPRLEFSKDPPERPRFLDDFPLVEFHTMVMSDADWASYLVGIPLTNGHDDFASDTFFEMMSIVSNIAKADFLGNPAKMSSAASTIFTFIGVQVATKFVVIDSTLPIDGEINRRALRLQISPLASWSMIAGLLFVSAGAVVLIFIRPRDAIPCNIGIMSGMAKVLRNSADFQATLRGCGGLKTKNILEILRPFTFESNTSSTLNFSINPIPKTTNDDWNRRKSARNGMEFWKPILQNLSGRTDGIVIIADPDTILVTFWTRFVPATIFMTVAVLYDSIEFNVAIFAPFARLKRGKARGKHTLAHTLLGRFSIEVLLSTLRHRDWAAGFATFAALLGSFLTIAASGLYGIEERPGLSSITAQRVDQFDPSWPDSVRDDAGAAALLTDIEVLNLPQPAWTSSQLVFPKIQLSPTNLARINGTTRPAIMVRVPVVRGELQCRISLPKVGVSYSDSYSADLIINGSVPVPAGCNVNASTIHWSSYQEASFEGVSLLGKMLDLHPGDSNYTFGEHKLPLQGNSPPGFPSLAFTFGRSSLEHSSEDLDRALYPTTDAFTTMSCDQLMAEVQTNVTLSVPGFTVISAVADESTKKYLASGPDGETAFAWRPQLHFQLEVTISDGEFTFGGLSAGIQDEYDSPYYSVDGFFSLLLQPGSGLRPEDLLGADNQDHLLDAIQSLYRRYMAQVASVKMRVPAGANSPPELYTATWENSNRGVVRQSPESKLALQILLGVMFACGMAAYLLVETQEVLPHDPCSIAGLASLLAGSSMCSEEAATAEQPDSGSDQDIFWTSQLFSLGWWPSSASEGGRFGIDVGEARWMTRED
ncbi:hypothetical protein Daus18300_009049 [Diaporthe australafricana]|uniref:Uncharacterized protein n=1 Tax=Diaporthe australafricana TaxID=127596 RepID=A0ABR3WFS8_9PEZI